MKKIIIVDRIRQLFDVELYPEGGEVETLTVSSNEDALNMYRKQKADLIITELHGSGLTGFELCSIIREEPALRRVSTIVFCEDSQAAIKEGVSCRANAVLMLPVNPALLRKTVQQLLSVPGRTHYRHSFIAHCARLSGRSFIECQVENISVTGMLIEANAVLKKGDRILCSLTLPPALSIETQAEVIRTAKTTTDHNLYGLRFSSLAPSARRAIETLLQQPALNNQRA